jgi:predicted RNA-binding Zn-ribbon protein involved in translation (DUF1610 family)
MQHPPVELVALFRRKPEVLDGGLEVLDEDFVREDLVRLTAAARASGSSWDDIAAEFGAPARAHPSGVVYRTAAEVVFRATQYAVARLTGSSRREPPLTWPCPGCGQEVTDRAATGRPAHVELGHAPGCARLARDQAADDERRRRQLPQLILDSKPPTGPMQRHRLRQNVIDDCPRCGWHGYFSDYVTVGGDWAAALCDGCFADLDPGITVTWQFYSAARWGGGEPFAVIRHRTRSDFDTSSGAAQIMTWRLWWEHTPKLVDEAHGRDVGDIREIGQGSAEQIAARLAARNWPPGAASLPWVAAACPR